jgi:S-DNA-T family DNA segregation ATPase FtsK/SpoIIIE
MDKRYALFAEKGVRNLQGYNTYALSNDLPKMPQIVIVIDELSDLMMAASNEVEDSICRLAQKARAAGMHLIVATQRPSVDVITGLIKANIPSRIAFAVKSQIDSRTIIDTQGAEKLLGNGDMLYCPVGLSKPVRVQGCYVSDDEIERVIEFVTSQGDVKYDDAVMQEIELKAAQDGKKKSTTTVEADSSAGGDYGDEMIPKAIEVVVEAGMASTTLLQRKLKLGYARAARIVDELSEMGIIGPFEGSKPRKVLITKDQWYEMQANSGASAPKQLSVDDIAPQQNTQVENNVQLPDNHNYFGTALNNEE